MAKTEGKVTTTKSRFISLAREVNASDSATVLAWLAVFREFVRCGVDDKQAFAKAFVLAVRGTKQDVFTENTVRLNVSLIEWAEANIVGGARACLSMNSIVKMRGGDFGKGKAKPVAKTTRKVSTVTINEDAFARALRKAGFSAVEIAAAAKAVFVTK